MSGGVLLGAGSWGFVRRGLCGGRGVGVEKGSKGSLAGIVGGPEAF